MILDCAPEAEAPEAEAKEAQTYGSERREPTVL